MPFLSAINRGRGRNHGADVKYLFYKNPVSKFGAKFLEWLLERIYGASEALVQENVAKKLHN
jgi:hypothetical protein